MLTMSVLNSVVSSRLSVLLRRWRNRLSVGLYNLSVHTLTFGLIGFGVCYKCKYTEELCEIVIII